MSARRHDTGFTIALTVALAVGLSFAPVPDEWRPLPSLRTEPGKTLVSVVAPALVGDGAGRATDAITGAPTTPDAVPEEPAEAGPDALAKLEAEAEEPLLPAQVLSPAARLGAPEARSVRALEKLAAQVGASHVDVEEGCREQGPDGCVRRALDHFFSDLELLARGESKRPVRVIHLGDSLIASDHITDLLRRRLQLRHGSGGTGFLFVDRPTRFSGRKVRTGEASEGWQIAKLTDKEERGLLGLSGVRFASDANGETTRFEAAGARHADLFFLTQPTGGVLEARADDQSVSRILTRFSRQEVAFAKVKLPAGTRQLSLRTQGGPVSLYGAALENGLAGVVYDSIGVPGGSAEVFLRADERAFSSQLAHRAPSLVVLMLGGNEAYEMGRGWMSLEKARRTSEQLIDRIQAAAPKASCLVVGPLDAAVRSIDGTITDRPFTREVADMLREVALSHGCAWWDAFAAMGGAGSARRWNEAELIHEDLAHPRALGSDTLGHLLDFALERGRLSRRGASAIPAADPPGLAGTEALAHTFARLRALEKGEGGAVSIVQLGASHTAAHFFTDEARARLSRVFGNAGRGYIAFGKDSPRLKRGRVERRLEGFWVVPDARERPAGEPWGLTGVRVEGQPGARATIAFGVGAGQGSEPGRLGLYLLEQPGMGTAEVRIDGKTVARLPEAPPEKSEARVVGWEVQGRSHTLEVVNVGAAPITLFGAALDLERPGIRYDAIGLPGSTAITADGYEKEAFRAQLEARGADLYVLFYGTNESAIRSLDAEELKQHYRSLLVTLSRASPKAECLILGPTDRLEKVGNRWVEAPSIDKVIGTLRALAAERGCAFWSARAAMGGPRSISRWQQLEPPLGHPDGVHLTKIGYEILAEALTDELLAAWRAAPSDPGRSPAESGAKTAAGQDATHEQPAKDARPAASPELGEAGQEQAQTTGRVAGLSLEAPRAAPVASSEEELSEGPRAGEGE